MASTHLATPVTPPALRRGDVIALLSPSARVNDVFPLRMARATEWLTSRGFVVKPIFTSNLADSPLSANAAARAAELHAAFEDPAVRAIVCTIGGMSCNELLPFLDPAIIQRNPKIFVGSSDITLLHHFLYVKGGLRTFYGASAVTQWGEWPQPLPLTAEHWERVVVKEEEQGAGELVGQMPRSVEFTDEFMDWEGEAEMIAKGTMRPRVLKKHRGWRWLRPGTARGVIWGGCLPSVLQLMGTEWAVDYTDKVMFIAHHSAETPEGDFPATGMPLERAIWHLMDLRLRGVFAQIRGLIVGRAYLFSDADEVAWDAAVVRAVEGYNFPVLAGVDVGHSDPMLTLPLGAEVKLDSATDRWEVLEAGVR